MQKIWYVNTQNKNPKVIHIFFYYFILACKINQNCSANNSRPITF